MSDWRSSSCWHAQRFMAQHLHREHNWGIRRIGKRLGLPDRLVREALWTDEKNSE